RGAVTQNRAWTPPSHSPCPSPTPTPSTLTVQQPYAPTQSMPDIQAASAPTLAVPRGHLGSPGSRGTTFPPPSPRSLQRSLRIPQSRNPPLMKVGHISESACTESDYESRHGIPLITGTPASPGSERSTPVEREVEESEESDGSCGTTMVLAPGSEANNPNARRLSRSEQRRYHTAGAIEDIKKQDSRDAGIYKRLSLNYGPNSGQGSGGGGPGKVPGGKCLSSDSMQSSSGVSSTGSTAQLSSLELDDDPHHVHSRGGEMTGERMAGEGGFRGSVLHPHGVSMPHISTTYISHGDTPTNSIYVGSDDAVLHHQLYGVQDQVRIDVPGGPLQLGDGQGSSSVQISIPGPEAEILKNLILSDSSIEASYV
ncbi:unnamed protein product, partial [Darwinula stevensoni]